MLDHIGINVSNLERSRAFYTRVLAPLGYEMRKLHPGAIGFGSATPVQGADPGGDFWIREGIPHSQCVHVAFRAASQAQVHAFYTAALAAGAIDNGAPGPRRHYHAHYYAAFVRDPDGYNIEAVTHAPG